MSEDINALFCIACVVMAARGTVAQGSLSAWHVVIISALVIVWVIVSRRRSRQADDLKRIPPKTPYPIHLLPCPGRRVRILFWIIGTEIILMLCVVNLEEGGFIGGLVFVAFLGSAFYRHKCPQCGTRMNAYRLNESPGRTRLYHDCHTCQVSWKSPIAGFISADGD
jgi:Ca2+/Na+ antiporter